MITTMKTITINGKSSLESVSSLLNLAGSVAILSGTTEKIIEISSYKNPEMLKSIENITIKEKMDRLKK